jgi:hypothetical protein
MFHREFTRVYTILLCKFHKSSYNDQSNQYNVPFSTGVLSYRTFHNMLNNSNALPTFQIYMAAILILLVTVKSIKLHWPLMPSSSYGVSQKLVIAL